VGAKSLARTLHHLRCHKKTGKRRRGHIRDIQLPDGRHSVDEILSGPFRDEEGNIIGAVEIVRECPQKQIAFSRVQSRSRRVRWNRQAEFYTITLSPRRMKAIFRLIERVASTMSSVLITGSSGTGTEHHCTGHRFQLPDRRNKPFVTVNCGAIPGKFVGVGTFRAHVRGVFYRSRKDHKASSRRRWWHPLPR